jgi:hypothetical protein
MVEGGRSKLSGGLDLKIGKADIQAKSDVVSVANV